MSHTNTHKSDEEKVETDVSISAPRDEEETVSEKKQAAPIVISKKALLTISAVILVLLVGYNYRGTFVAATVNGSPITRAEVTRTLEKASGAQVLESLIVEKLIAQEAAKRGIVVSTEDVDIEAARITKQVTDQGGKLEELLAAQGMTVEDFTKKLTLQITLEKMLGDKVSVTKEEVDAYIADNKIKVTAEEEESTRASISDGLKSQKMGTAVQPLLDELRAAAKISVIVQY